MTSQAAPHFVLAGPGGVPVTNASVAGQATLLLFVPSAFSPVCTQEVREHGGLDELRQLANLVVVSCDTAHTLTAWLAHLGVSAAVGSDFWPHGQVARQFDAFDESTGWPRRRSVLLSAGGDVLWSDRSAPGRARDPQVALRAIRDFGVA